MAKLLFNGIRVTPLMHKNTEGLNNQDLNVSINGTYTYESGYTGVGEIIVAVPNGVETKSITTNGTYTPTSPNVGFSSVTVNVPNGVETKSITTNGTYTPTSPNVGFSSVTVNVPNGTETKTITSDGTFTPTSPNIGFSSVTVAVPANNQDLSITGNGTYTFGSGYSGLGTITVNVPASIKTKIGLNVDNFVGDTDANDVLQPVASAIPASSLNFSGIADLGDYALYFKFNGKTVSGVLDMSNIESISGSYAMHDAFYSCTSLTSVDLSSLQVVSNSNAMYQAFYNCSSLTSVDLSSLQTVSGNNVMSYVFAACTSLSSLDLSSLETVSGTQAMQYAFQNCTSLISVDLSSLQTVSGQYVMQQAFYGCTSLTSLDLSSLQTVSGQYAMQQAFASSKFASVNFTSLITTSGGGELSYTFYSCTSLTSVSFPVLEAITGSGAMQYIFYGCSSLTSVNFPSLKAIPNSQAMTYAFQNCTSLKTLSFPRLKDFGTQYLNQFQAMLNGCSNITLHFRYDMEDKIKSLTGYSATAPFGASSGSVLFDLSKATLQFNITSSSAATIYVDNVLQSSTSFYVSSTEDHEYFIINEDGIIATGTILNLVDDEVRTITIDLSSYKTITVSTGVPNLSYCKFKIAGILTDAIEGSSGNYSINVSDSVSAGIELPYYIVDDNYAPYYSSVTYNGSNVTESIILTSCTKSTFTRPDLTTNGALGGPSFAVSADSNNESSYPAWKAMDNSISTYWQSKNLNDGNISPTTKYADYIIYNPNFFLVGSLTLTSSSTSYCPYDIYVYTSVDGINWDLDQTVLANTSASKTITMNTTLPYKYVKLNMNIRYYYYYHIYLTNITFLNTYEWVVSNTYTLTVNTTPSDAVVLFTSPNASGKTAQIPYAGTVQYTAAKAGYKSVSGVVSTINTAKTVNVSLTESATPDTTWYAWTSGGTTVYTQTETPEATLDWTFSAPNTIANVISAVDTNTIISNGVTYTKASASNVEGYLTTQFITIQTDAYTSNNTEFYLPIEILTPYALMVDWGDGNTELVQGVGTYPHHTYSVKGTYQISIKSELCKIPRLIGTLYNNSTYKNPNYQIISMNSLMLPMYQSYLEDFNDFNTDTSYYLTWQAKNMVKSCSDFTKKANLEVYKCLFDGDTKLSTTKGKDLSNVEVISKYSEYNSVYQLCSGLTGTLDLSRLVTINGSYGLSAAFTQCTGLTSVDLSSLTTVSGDYAMNYTFQSCSNLAGTLDLSSLTVVSGSYGMQYSFQSCTKLTSVDLSNLTTILGTYALYFAFAYCSSLSSINLSSLKTISSSRGLCYTFRNCTSLTSVSLPQLSTVSGSEGVASCFYGCTKLSSVSLPSLLEVTGSDGLTGLLEGCSLITTVNFPLLQRISGSQCLRACFKDCTSLEAVSFPSLNVNSFGSYTNQFTNMLQGCSNVTVHFPSILKSTLRNWDDVKTGFGGTNTTVLFDIGGCEVTFNCTPSTNNQITIDGVVLSGNSSFEPKGAEEIYHVFNTDSYKLYIGQVTIPDSNSTTVSVDTTQATTAITIDTGVSGLDVTYTIHGITYTPEDLGNGKYRIYIYAPSGVSIAYEVNGGDNYMDASGAIQYTGGSTDITETVTLTPATISTFTQPVLTSNGTLGGSTCAALTGPSTSSSVVNNAYKIFDGDTSTNPFSWNWYVDGSSWYWEFYCPNAIKISSFTEVWTNTGSYYIPTYTDVYGSSNGINWTLITSYTRTDFNNINQTVTVNSPTFYKYHKVECRGNGYTMLKEVTLTATKKVAAS